MSKLLYTVLYSILTLSLYGCASGPPMTVSTMMRNTVYANDCMGYNSKHSYRDPICQNMGRPVPNDMTQYRVSRPSRADVRVAIVCDWSGSELGRTPEQVLELKRLKTEYERAGACE